MNEIAIFVTKFKPMIKNLTKTLALGLILLGALACGGGSDGPDTEAPTVAISKPNTTDIYKRGSDLPLMASFNDNRGLKKCVITIEYIGPLPGVPSLKGIDTPWYPAEKDQEHVINFNEEKSRDVNEAQLFNMPIELSCSSGVYRLTFTISDNAETPNVATETLDIKIGG